MKIAHTPPARNGNPGIVPPWLQHPLPVEPQEPVEVWPPHPTLPIESAVLGLAYIVQYNDYDRLWEVVDDIEYDIYRTAPTQREAVRAGADMAKRARTLLIVQDEAGRVQRQIDYRTGA